MLIEIGKDMFRSEDRVIGIFDLDITSQSKITREYLKQAEKNGKVENAADDLPKTFLICKTKDEKTEVLLSGQSSTAFYKKYSEKDGGSR